MSSIHPVFIKNRDIPEGRDRISGLELCLAAEQSAGRGTIVGAQDIRGLWRIYPATAQARNELLVKGIVVRECSLQLSNTNPFILREGSGEEKLTTKLFVSDIPLSVANSEIEHGLSKIGCELRSAINMERYRDADNKLTRFETGRRFVFITIPPKPLEKTLTIANFQAKLYHKEQKELNKSVICSNCLKPNHHASVCVSAVVCRVCKGEGHKQGDSQCLMREAMTAPVNAKDREAGKETNSRSQAEGVEEAGRRSQEGAAGGTGMEKERGREQGRDKDRGRQGARQTTLHSSMPRLDQHARHRSFTPKRRRSRDKQPGSGEGAKGRKAAKNDDDDDHDSDEGFGLYE